MMVNDVVVLFGAAICVGGGEKSLHVESVCFLFDGCNQ